MSVCNQQTFNCVLSIPGIQRDILPIGFLPRFLLQAAAYQGGRAQTQVQQNVVSDRLQKTTWVIGMGGCTSETSTTQEAETGGS
jgi:hypothetical protein